MTQEILHVRISGRVQGVYYRQWTVETAREKGLSGWVRNRTDGTVEAVFQGDSEVVSEMFQACKEGSRMSLVTKVELQKQVDAPMEVVEKGVFEQKRTI